MMTIYHIHCGAISPGVPDVSGSNPGWIFFLLFFLIRPIIITLIIFYFYSGWSLGVAVPGICIYYGDDFRTIFFLLSVSACLKKKNSKLANFGF